MAILDVVKVGTLGNQILYQPARRVRDFGPRLHTLLDNMLETAQEAKGVGIAGPQVGVGLRVTVIEFPEDEDDPENTMRLYEFINPEILKSKGMDVEQEGCLSIPGFAADVRRPTQIVVRAQDRNGKTFRLKAYDWLARIIQHEVDHLHGILMTDRADQLYKLQENEEGEVEGVPIEDVPGFLAPRSKLKNRMSAR